MKNFFLISIVCLYVNASWAADSEENQAGSAETTDVDSESKASDQVAIIRALPRLKKDQELDLALELTNSFTQVIKLTALDTEFDLYYLTAEEKEPIGSLLFFPDERSHSDWPISLNPLRVGLTKHKWQTAVLTLPEPELTAIPNRTEYPSSGEDQQAGADETAQTNTNSADATQTDPESAADTAATATDSDLSSNPEEVSKTLAEVSVARAVVAAQMLKQTSDALIIVGIGQGATWATAYALTLAPAEKDKHRLLLINPLQSLDKSAPILTDMIRQLNLDTYDIYTPSQTLATGNPNAEQGRKRAANRSKIEQYLQIKAPNSAWKKSGNTWLFRKVRGILKNKVEAQFTASALVKKRPAAAKKINQKPGSTNN